MKNYFNLLIISLFFIFGCASSKVVEGNKGTTTVKNNPPSITIPIENQENTQEILTLEKDKSLTVTFPAGWKKANVKIEEGKGTTTSFSNGLYGKDEKFFIVFESLLTEESKTFDLEKLFESFKTFCHSSLGSVDFSPTKVIVDKKSGLVFNAALGIELTQPSLFIVASTKFSENVAFSFICFETDQNFKTCGKIFESIKQK